MKVSVPRIILGVLAVTFIGTITPKIQAIGTTYTVCAAACDFTSLSDAVMTPGLNQDTIILATGFIFDDSSELDNIFIPDEITLQCDPGVMFGDALQDPKLLWVGSDNIIQDCRFENISFDASGKTNVDFLNNSISSAAQQTFTFTNTDGFEVSGNTGIQKVQVQNADNGLIDNNEFECRFGNNCIVLSTSGGGPFDYSDPADVPSFIDITNNTITNYNVTSGGDFVLLYAGVDNTFTNNTISSGVTVDNNFITMITVQNGNSYVAENIFFMPEKAGGGGSGTWAINMRISDADLSTVIENNTVIMNENNIPTGGNACIGLFEPGGLPNYLVSVEANYNLCYNPLSSPNGNGVALNYNPGSITLTFQDTFNGIFNTQGLISDGNAIFTTLNANTVTSDPLFKRENIDINDDYELNPISRYLDVDGTRDIGAFPDARVTNYFIDDTCAVDYTTCYSNGTEVLPHAVSSGDTITIADGTYSAFELEYPANNVTLSGGGNGTIIDAAGIGSGLIITTIADSIFDSFKLTNSMAAILTTYELTNIIYDYGGNTYNQTSGFFGSDDVTLVFEDIACNVVPVDEDGTDVTTAVGGATDDWNLALIDVFGGKITVLVPDRFASNIIDLEAYMLTNCGVPATVDVFVPGIFTVAAQKYTYDEAAVTLEGATLAPGFTNPPKLDQLLTIEESAGLFLQDADNNIFQNLFIDSNTIGINMDSESEGNNIKESIFSNNVTKDVVSNALNDNSFEDTIFDINKAEVAATGDLRIYYTVQLTAKDGTTHNPIANANVTVKDAHNSTIATLITGISGQTPLSLPLLATVLAQGDPTTITEGGYNPFSFIVSATQYTPVTGVTNIMFPQQQIDTSLLKTGGTSGGGGGGGGGIASGGSGAPSAETPSDEETLHGSSPEEETGTDSEFTDCTEFNDTQNHWARNYIQTLKELNYIQGYADCSFKPDQAINRAEVSKLITLWKNPSLENIVCMKSPFPDVECKSWYGEFIQYLKDNGIVEGYKDTFFHPERNMSRAETLKVFILIKNISGIEIADYPNPFCDVDKKAWFYERALIGSKIGRVAGYPSEDPLCTTGKELRPNQPITRAEFTKVFQETLLNR